LRDFRAVYKGTIADESLRQYVMFDAETIDDFRDGENASDTSLGDFIREYRKSTVDMLEDLLASHMPPADAAREINDAVRRYEDAYENRFSDEAKIQSLMRWERKDGGQGPDYGDEEELFSEKLKRALLAVLMSPHYLIYLFVFVCIVSFAIGFTVPSSSMEPTLIPGDKIFLLRRYLADGKTYARGDIVCFHRPKTGETYVRRIVAIGGDVVTIDDDGLYVNGELSPYQGAGTSNSTGTWNLADDEYFMMGDNRSNSEDSRYIGPIKANALIGKVTCVYWPINRFEMLGGSGIFGL
jgi:signal peptidase I